MTPATKIIQAYEALAAQMQAMLDAAKQQDWDKVSDLETLYQAKVEQIKLQKADIVLNKMQQARKVALIKQILQDDQAIQNLIYPRMEELTKLISGSQNSVKLNRTYGY